MGLSQCSFIHSARTTLQLAPKESSLLSIFLLQAKQGILMFKQVQSRRTIKFHTRNFEGRTQKTCGRLSRRPNGHLSCFPFDRFSMLMTKPGDIYELENATQAKEKEFAFIYFFVVLRFESLWINKYQHVIFARDLFWISLDWLWGELKYKMSTYEIHW